MTRMNAIGRWFVLPFGSLKLLAILFAVYTLSRIADLASTYWFLSKAGFDLTEEGNPIMQMVFVHLGVFGGMLFNLIFFPIQLLFVAALCSHIFRRKKPRFARVLPVAIFVYGSIIGFFIAIDNFDVFYSIYLALSSFPTIQGVYNYSFTIIFISSPLWIGFISIFPLYKFGYGKKKALIT